LVDSAQCALTIITRPDFDLVAERNGVEAAGGAFAAEARALGGLDALPLDDEELVVAPLGIAIRIDDLSRESSRRGELEC